MKIFKIILKGFLSLFVLLGGFSISKIPSSDFSGAIKSRLFNLERRGLNKNSGLILTLGMAACNTPAGPTHNHGSHSSHASHSSHSSALL
jgi:hypothetical protein